MDLCGSDHYPINIVYEKSPSFETNSSWKLSKADWNAFSDEAAAYLIPEYTLNSNDPIGSFTDILTNVANNTIPKSKPRVVKHNTIWFNDDCKAVIRN